MTWVGRVYVAVWLLVGADLGALTFTLSPTDAVGDYSRFAWFAFSIEVMWALGTIAVGIAFGLLLGRHLRGKR